MASKVEWRQIARDQWISEELGLLIEQAQTIETSHENRHRSMYYVFDLRSEGSAREREELGWFEAVDAAQVAAERRTRL